MGKNLHPQKTCLRQQGKGKLPNRARSLTPDEENVLWESKELGDSSPRSLIQTVWWYNCLHFGMRGRQEHYDLKLEHFKIEKDRCARTCVSYIEGLTKKRNAGLNFQPRNIQPKMYETGAERCPIKMSMAYKSRRPAHLQETGPLYLGVIDHPKSGVWYKNMKMGVHTINNMLKNMKNRSPLATICPNKKITNHSARKTTVSKMRKSGFPKCEIMYSMSRAINGETST